MNYLFHTAKQSYEHFASGKVLYNAPGTTSFPVRLASEIVQRCFHLLREKGVSGPYHLYDPCCGGGYMLTVIGLLHHDRINRITASDQDQAMVKFAAQNLSLLRPDGLAKRKEQVRELFELYQKPSHMEALQSADYLMGLVEQSSALQLDCFQADSTVDNSRDERCRNAHIILTDLPYGGIVDWISGSASPVHDFFESMHKIASPASTVLAVIADKSQSLRHPKFKRLQVQKIGKRHFALFEPLA
ncbi:hypothetical protein [Paenibacillus spongiae]|uniref:rRNA methyltransferase n=1 Tax=Paenibacillus spongiae TaxID=2909671 RepID=A0ABY5SCP3_9BACL|nr:hypothetical protein [Paenibacillus spongiae]UVI30058.1 hypothetical protein L1F29_32555 [Paenibacillus spongiae]